MVIQPQPNDFDLTNQNSNSQSFFGWDTGPDDEGEEFKTPAQDIWRYRVVGSFTCSNTWASVFNKLRALTCAHFRSIREVFTFVAAPRLMLLDWTR